MIKRIFWGAMGALSIVAGIGLLVLAILEFPGAAFIGLIFMTGGAIEVIDAIQDEDVYF